MMVRYQKKYGRSSRITTQSVVGLNAINFFQAEMVGVVMPLIGVFLREHQWRYDAIGIATAAAGLGTLLLQTPAGIFTDRISSRRLLFAIAAILTGLCYSIIPFLPNSHRVVDAFLFVSGAAQSFFPPLLGALALGLVGHDVLNKMAGENQGWNHAGNIAAALAAMALAELLNVFHRQHGTVVAA
jgi:MFS family permease